MRDGRRFEPPRPCARRGQRGTARRNGDWGSRPFCDGPARSAGVHPQGPVGSDRYAGDPSDGTSCAATHRNRGSALPLSRRVARAAPGAPRRRPIRARRLPKRRQPMPIEPLYPAPCSRPGSCSCWRPAARARRLPRPRPGVGRTPAANARSPPTKPIPSCSRRCRRAGCSATRNTSSMRSPLREPARDPRRLPAREGAAWLRPARLRRPQLRGVRQRRDRPAGSGRRSRQPHQRPVAGVDPPLRAGAGPQQPAAAAETLRGPRRTLPRGVLLGLLLHHARPCGERAAPAGARHARQLRLPDRYLRAHSQR
ncbi:hypothetical protein PASLES2_14170 [Pseudomonas aeruginosa]